MSDSRVPVGPGDVRVQRVSEVSAPGEHVRPLDPVVAGTQLVVARFPEPAEPVPPQAGAAGAALIGDRPIASAPPPPVVPAVEAPGEPSARVVSIRDGAGAPSRLDHRVADVPQAPVVSRIIQPDPPAPTEHAPVAEVAEPVVVSRAAETEPAAEPIGPEPVATAPVAPGSPGAPAAPGASTSATEVDALVGRIYDPLVRRLKAELRLERERAGHVLDLRM